MIGRSEGKARDAKRERENVIKLSELIHRTRNNKTKIER